MAASLSGTALASTAGSAATGRNPVAAAALPSAARLSLALAQRAGALRLVRSSPSTPPGLSEMVSESIKRAEEACEGDAASGECAAAWDEVEELSAAASHARDRSKESDPLENYCKDNPETDECRTYED
ncbi:Calvin cycle protein CP12-2, chloroplastic [Apostasia shenzhenica]|uniref:Calvin cycle protein CP12-2, chloroplastic n=1 Tax=Apostasia shenzhenica TaxID=1088818 RepID=A0A2H9ZYX7_9ASPA|nr:Calvin cycle protein CP12-2, chloroplastic [Apostasia shenzhenica]